MPNANTPGYVKSLALTRCHDELPDDDKRALAALTDGERNVLHAYMWVPTQEQRARTEASTVAQLIQLVHAHNDKIIAFLRHKHVGTWVRFHIGGIPPRGEGGRQIVIEPFDIHGEWAGDEPASPVDLAARVIAALEEN
jgi:hypothetical protein